MRQVSLPVGPPASSTTGVSLSAVENTDGDEINDVQRVDWDKEAPVIGKVLDGVGERELDPEFILIGRAATGKGASFAGVCIPADSEIGAFLGDNGIADDTRGKEQQLKEDCEQRLTHLSARLFVRPRLWEI